jgi:S1-C subfamily serine protease
MGADPIGMYEGRAFSESILGSETTIKLDSGASLTLRLSQPEPKQGVGIVEYELRPSSVLVLAIAPNSPAARARLASGDRILTIDGKAVASLGSQETESALALAAQKESELRVARDKAERTVKIDNGYVWPAM